MLNQFIRGTYEMGLKRKIITKSSFIILPIILNQFSYRLNSKRRYFKLRLIKFKCCLSEVSLMNFKDTIKFHRLFLNFVIKSFIGWNKKVVRIEIFFKFPNFCWRGPPKVFFFSIYCPGSSFNVLKMTKFLKIEKCGGNLEKFKCKSKTSFTFVFQNIATFLTKSFKNNLSLHLINAGILLIWMVEKSLMTWSGQFEYLNFCVE